MDAIQSKLIYVDTREAFDALLDEGAFRNQSIVFIGDTLEFWTHGKMFCSSTVILDNLIWQLNTREDDGYVPASGTNTDVYWGVPEADTDNPNPEPQWISIGKWNVNHGGTNKNTSDWATDLANTYQDIVLVSKTTGNSPIVSFSTLGTTDIQRNEDRQILVNDVTGIRWYNESLLDVAHATSASTADALNHVLNINGYIFNGTEDIDAGVIDIVYGGTSKTAFSATGTDTHAWFELSEFDVHTTSYKNKLVTIYGESNGEILTDISFNTTDIPTLATGEYALVNTTAGLAWTDLGTYLQAASAMVFKGTVNCNIANEITNENITPMPLNWQGAELGWTYIVTDQLFEVVLDGDPHGTYGTVDVGDLLICMQSATDTSVAKWAIVQNKISAGVTYVGLEDPLATLLWPEGTGSQVSYIALSYGTTPTQIHYYQDGANGLWVDSDGWIHGKFYGAIIGNPTEEVAYAKWITDSGVIQINSASDSSATNILTTISSNAIRLRMEDYGNFIYGNPTIWDVSTSGSTTIFHIYELTGSAGNYTNATAVTANSLNSMSNGLTKKVTIGCLSTTGGFIGGNGTTMKLVAHQEYRDVSASILTQWQYNSSQNTSLKNEAYQKANSFPEIVLTLTRVDGGFTILNKDELYLNCALNDSSDALTAGGSIYNPIYIDTEGLTRTTDLYSYNIMKLYTAPIIGSWSVESRNELYDDLYVTYNNQDNTAGYGKNLIIPIISAPRLLGDNDDSVRLGAIIQWSNSTANTTNNLLLFGDNINNTISFRSQTGDEWNNWITLADVTKFDDYYPKSYIDELEEVIAASLTELKGTLSNYNKTEVDELLENAINLEDYYTKTEIDDAHYVITLALTDLNDRLVTLETNLDAAQMRIEIIDLT